MANLKFSDFTAYATTPVTATSGLVAYEGTTNIQFTPVQLAPFTGIYAADGTVGSGRVATVTDTLTFNNSSNQNILKISNEVCIGQLAQANNNTTVAIGLDSRATGGSTTAVGSYARATNGNSSAFGHNAQTTKVGALVVGYYSKSLGDYGVSVGYACGAANGTAANVVNIGKQAKGEGANSITIASNGSSTAPTTANTFGVYMTSNTTPDFQIAHDGNSFITGTGNFGIGTSSPLYTLDTKGSVAGNWLARVENDSGTGLGLQVKVNSTDSTKRTFSTRNANGYTMSVYNDGVVEINGQAYTELHTNATNLVVNWNDGNVQAVTISGSAPTFAPTNPKAGATYILTLTQGATPVTVDFNSLVKWSGGAPTLSSTTGQIDVITLICYNDSGSGLYYGAASLNLA